MKDKEYDTDSGDFILCTSLEIIIVCVETGDESHYRNTSVNIPSIGTYRKLQ